MMCASTVESAVASRARQEGASQVSSIPHPSTIRLPSCPLVLDLMRTFASACSYCYPVSLLEQVGLRDCVVYLLLEHVEEAGLAHLLRRLWTLQDSTRTMTQLAFGRRHRGRSRERSGEWKIVRSREGRG